jgi:uncharacterized protein
MTTVIETQHLSPMTHRFRSGAGEHLLVVPFSRVFDLSADDAATLDADPDTLGALAASCAEAAPGEAALDQIVEPNPQSISLNVSSSCNLGCAYCYAARGSFGGTQSAPMTWPVARAAIDRLLAVAQSDRPITVGFLGGEPFANRNLIHASVGYASAEAHRLGLDVRFSVTTNGTLLRPADLDLMRSHPFAVTVSLDGAADVNDAQRPMRNGRPGAWERATRGVAGLLADPGQAKLAARATVTRQDMDVSSRLEALIQLGFPEVGVAPLRTGPDATAELQKEDWAVYLQELIRASDVELLRLKRGLPARLTNFAVALKQLHRGACSPYPCGAGGGYFSVAAGGRWYACHRAVGNPAFEMGSSDGLDTDRRRRFLEARHVHAQTDCRTCWARYLCSGGCHQEAESRTAASCDFVRGWLEFCLAAYCELSGPFPGGDRR